MIGRTVVDISLSLLSFSQLSKMPAYKKRRITKKKVSRKSTRLSNVSRPMYALPWNSLASENNVKEFRRTLSIQSAQPGTRLSLNSSLTGTPLFNCIVSGVGSFTGADLALNFSLQQMNMYLNGILVQTFAVPSSAEFQNLFDEYMIDHVDLIFTGSTNIANSNAGSALLPVLIGVEDNDDSADTAFTQIQQYTKAKQWQYGTTHRVRISPRIQIAAYQTGATFAFSSAPDRSWVDTAASSGLSAFHYGYKMSPDNFNVASASTYYGDLDIQAVMHFKMRTVR